MKLKIDDEYKNVDLLSFVKCLILSRLIIFLFFGVIVAIIMLVSILL